MATDVAAVSSSVSTVPSLPSSSSATEDVGQKKPLQHMSDGFQMQIISRLRTPRESLNLALTSKCVHLLARNPGLEEKIDQQIRQGVTNYKAFTELLGEIERTEASACSELLGRLILDIPRMRTRQIQQPLGMAATEQQLQAAEQSAFEQSLNAIHRLPGKHRATPLQSLAGVFTGRETRSVSLKDPATVFNRLLDEVRRLPDLDHRKVLLRSDMAPALLKLPENTRAEAYYRLLDAVNEILQSGENNHQSSDDAIAAGVPPDDWLRGDLIVAAYWLPESSRVEALTRALNTITKPGALRDDLRTKLADWGAGHGALH
ncbi:hypothetical protein [Pandoraea pulmonicola]|nr:hypothetical protein [Pandoraea pulmonicola]